MSKEVYLLSKEGKAAELEGAAYKGEAELQEILENNPNLLLRESDVESGNELYLVKRELTLPGTLLETTDLSLDHFMVDKYGVPVLVEVKLTSNQEIRRKVVGQMLEYAARISFYDSTELQEMYYLQNGDEAPMDDQREFWRTVSSNLRAGRMKLVFAADEIPNTLKLIIEMLDRAMQDVEVYGVEIKKHIDGGQVFLSTSFVLNTAKTIIRQENVAWNGKKWTDSDAEERLKAMGCEWAVEFFKTLKTKCSSLGLKGKYGNAETYLPFRWYYNGNNLFSFDIGKTKAGIYFNSKTIDTATNHNFAREDLVQRLSYIDPNPKYTKQKKPVYYRTLVQYYEDHNNQERLFELLEMIMTVAAKVESDSDT